jgi:WD40 repeat protein/energy-coupling factor transporter ATP-binding protein EcfA2
VPGEGALSAERPFPGLRPFGYSDHAFFFGREEQSYALYNLLELSQFVAVVGSSGSGKSSLVRAGLLPLLARESEEVLARHNHEASGRPWRWIELRPGNVPLSRLADRLADLFKEQETEEENAVDRAAGRERIDYTLHRSSFGLIEALAGIDVLASHSLLIVVDQFEELFRYAGSGTARQRLQEEGAQFVQLLLEATSGRSREVHVLITMRSDFIGDCAQFYGLPEAVSACQFLVPSLTRDQREEVVRRPLERAGAAIEPSLLERLLNDVGNDLDQLPVLQHCLLRLWEAANRSSPVPPRRHLKLEHYRAVGGIAGALSQHADEILASLPGHDLSVEQVFRSLSEVDKERRATRRALPFRQLLAETGVAELALRTVLDRFRADDCSFLVPSLSAVTVLSNENRIDVGHEALLRRWDRISTEPVAEVEGERRRGGWLWREESDGHTYRALLALLEGGRTLPLDQVEARWTWWNERPRTTAWAERYGGDIDRVRQLFDDSHAALAAERDRQATAERAERERREERETAARRLAQRTLIAAIAMGLLALIATGFGIFGLIEAREALRQSALAESKTAEATARLDEARLNESRFLTSMGETALSKGNPELAGLIARAVLPTDVRNSEHLQGPSWLRAVGTLADARDSDRLRAALVGHTAAVESAAYSSDGARIVTGSADNTGRIWDTKTGAQLTLLAGHTAAVWSAAYSPDGARIVTASEDKTARIWDAKTGAQITLLEGHSAAVDSAVFSPDGARIVTASTDNTARIWDAKTGAQITLLAGHTAAVWSAAYSPDGARIVTASEDETARIWDAKTGAQLAMLEGHSAAVDSAVFSPDGARMVTASDDNTARIWDATTGAQLAMLEGHTAAIWSASYSPDGAHIVTASADNTARIWDAKTGAQRVVLEGHRAEIDSAAYSPDGAHIVTASEDNTARIWDAKIGAQLATLAGHSARVWSAAYSPDGARIVTASEDRTARIWDATTGAQLAALAGHTAEIYGATYSPNGARIVTASKDKTARIWDAITGAQLAILEGHSAAIWSASYSPDGARIVTSSEDKSARIWDVKTGAQLATLAGHTAEVWSAAYSPDGGRILTASNDNTARMWDVKTGAQVATLEGHTGGLWRLAYSPDGARIVTASDDKTARIWDAKTGAELAMLTGHTDKVENAVFSPDGARIVTASKDNTVRIWEVWPLLTADTITYATISAIRALTAGERAQLFLTEPVGEAPSTDVSGASANEIAGMSLEQLRATAAKNNPYAHRRLAELCEHGEASLEQAVFHHAIEAQLFEQARNENEAQIARARRGSDARALMPQEVVHAAYEAMDWRATAPR